MSNFLLTSTNIPVYRYASPINRTFTRAIGLVTIHPSNRSPCSQYGTPGSSDAKLVGSMDALTSPSSTSTSRQTRKVLPSKRISQMR